MPLTTDLRYALRRLLQSKGFSVASVLMLALGIAISATMFAVLRGVLGSLPYPDAEQLVVVESANPAAGQQQGALTPLEAARLDTGPSPFTDFGYYVWGGMTVLSEQRPRELRSVSVSSGFFSTMATPPALGRWFNSDDHVPGATAVILSHAEWQQGHGGSEQVIGQRFNTSAGMMEVVGVMPADYNAPGARVQVWLPLAAGAYPLEQAWTHTARFLYAHARLDPALSTTQVDAQLAAISAELTQRHALEDGRWTLGTRDLLSVQVGDVRGVLWGAFAVAMLVLLIACANVAILIDARQIARRQQFAVLQALGASRARVYLALLLEIALLSLFAVALGALLTSLSVQTLRELAAGSLPRSNAIAVDQPLWLFVAALALAAPLLAAAAGSLRLRGQAQEAIRGGARSVLGDSHSRSWLPTLGVALSTVSLCAGGVLLYSFLQLRQVDPGFAHQQVHAMQLFHGDGAQQQRQFAAALVEQLRAIPGADQVAVTSAAPLSVIGSSSVELKANDDAYAEPITLGLRRVSTDYQQLLQIPLLAGRAIADSDRDGAEPVVVINQALAQRLYGNQSALNQTIELPLNNELSLPHRVIGVSADVSNRGLRLPAGPEAWIPFDAQPSMAMTFLLRSDQPIAGIDNLFKDALYAVDQNEATTRIFALSAEIDDELAPARFFAGTVGAFALAALLLAAAGVYAVAALRQQQRVAEFGLRLAIGARPKTLVRAALGDSVRSLSVGVGAGLLGAWAILQLLQNQLYALEEQQPWVLAAATGLLLACATLAALIPALKAQPSTRSKPCAVSSKGSHGQRVARQRRGICFLGPGSFPFFLGPSNRYAPGAAPNCASDSFQKPRSQVRNMSASRSPERASSESYSACGCTPSKMVCSKRSKNSVQPAP